MNKEIIIRKLTSRKFWMAIIGFVTGLLVFIGKSEAEAEQIGSLILMGASVLAYAIGEGLADQAAVIEVEPKPPEEEKIEE